MGSFADVATKKIIKETNRQKKIVFGERPTTISAQCLKASTRTLDKDETDPSKSLVSQQTSASMS